MARHSFGKTVVVAVIKSVVLIQLVTVTVDRYVVDVSVEAVDIGPWIKISSGVSAGRVPPVYGAGTAPIKVLSGSYGLR